MRRLTIVGALSASAALGLAATPALAWNSWCDNEPPVQVVTPDGHHLTINNWISVPVQDRHLLANMVVYGEAERGEQPGTSIVTIHVLTPGGGSRYVHVTSSTDRFRAVTSADGDWDSEITLQLTVPED